MATQEEVESGVVNFAELADWWKALRGVMATDDPIRDAAEWRKLDDYFDPPAEDEDAGAEVYTPKPAQAWDGDPAGTRKAEVVKRAVNKRLWTVMLSATSGKGELVNLWVKPSTLLKEGWQIWVKPKDGGEPGRDWELVGGYNTIGERLE